MKNFVARLASVATLALATVPVAALSTAAHAQNADMHYASQRVHVADLNLASPAGKAAFSDRVDIAARHLCVTEKSLNLRAACQAGVRAEANERAVAGVQMASRN
jgi:UrcA family protein